MAKIQIALKLDTLSENQLVSKGNEISTGLTDNAADFTGISPTAAAIATATTTADDAITDAANKTKAAQAATIAKDAAIANLKTLLTDAAKWTESNVKDPVKVSKVFPLRKTPSPTPGIVQTLNLMLDFGGKSGQVAASWSPTPGARSYEVQVRYRDQAGSAWGTVKTLSASKYTIPGLTSGQVVQVRVRAIGSKGIEGEWSDLAEHMVP